MHEIVTEKPDANNSRTDSRMKESSVTSYEMQKILRIT